MYGGGQWTTQNKVLGGAYINFYFGGARDHESVRAWRGIHAS